MKQSPPVHHLCCIDFSNASLIHPPSSYLTPLSHIIFKNIAHVGSFSHFVFVFVFVFVFDFVFVFVFVSSLKKREKILYSSSLCICIYKREKSDCTEFWEQIHFSAHFFHCIFKRVFSFTAAFCQIVSFLKFFFERSPFFSVFLYNSDCFFLQFSFTLLN